MSSLPKEIEALLDGIPWHIEQGGRHKKLFVGGRLAGVFPNDFKPTRDRRALLNTRAQVRRAILAYQEARS